MYMYEILEITNIRPTASERQKTEILDSVVTKYIHKCCLD